MAHLAELIRRLRWRRRGAWMWPTFAAATVADDVIGHALPSSGQGISFGEAMITALVLNLLVVALVCRPFGVALRMVRPDLPAIVARDHAGTALLLLVCACLLFAGVAHRPGIIRERAMLRDAIVRAQAWIGARAPEEFRANLNAAETVRIEPGLYRVCVPDHRAIRTYCVVVHSSLPLERSVAFDGYESNRVFMLGADP